MRHDSDKIGFYSMMPRLSLSWFAYFLGVVIIITSIILLIVYNYNNDNVYYYTGLGMFIGGISWIFVVWGFSSMMRSWYPLMHHKKQTLNCEPNVKSAETTCSLRLSCPPNKYPN